MSGAILRKEAKDVACEEWGWVAGRVFSFCKSDVTKVAEFGIGVSARTLVSFTGYEEGSDRNMMTYEISKVPSKSIYIYHHLFTSVNDSEMITQNFLRPATNHRYFLFIL